MREKITLSLDFTDAMRSAMIGPSMATIQRTVVPTSATLPVAPDHTVLVIEDSHDVTQSAAPFLIGEGYRVLPTHGPEAAVQLFSVFAGTRAALLLIDCAALERGGPPLLQRFRELDPALPVIVRAETVTRNQRRRLMRTFDLHGIYERSHPAAELLELIDSALGAARRLAAWRAQQELHGLIMAKLCHDLRSSLHVIQGYTEVLRLDPVTAPVEEILVRLNAASESAVELAQSYLDLSSLEALGGGLRRELVSIDGLIEDVRTEAARQIGDRRVRVTTIVPFPGSFIRTDEEKLHAVLAELIANVLGRVTTGEVVVAVDFAPDRTDFIVRDASLRPLYPPSAAGTLAFGPRARAAAGGLPGEGIGFAIALRLSALLGGSLAAGRGEEGGAMLRLSVPGGAVTHETATAPTLH